MGPRARLRVKLHGECAQLGVVNPLAASVVCVDEAELRRRGKGRRHDGVAVVLARDAGAPVGKVAHRLICAAVTEFQLLGRSARGDRGELMPEADSEQGYFPEKLCDLRDLERVVGGVAGTVRQHYAVKAPGEDILGAGRMREHGDGRAARGERTDDVALCTEVKQRDAVFFAFGGEAGDLAAAHLFNGIRDAVGGERLMRHCRGIGHDRGVYRTLGADDPRELARIDAADSGDVVFAQEGVEILLRTEIRRRIAQLAHDVAAAGAFALEILGDDTVISDEGEGLHYYLTGVARIGQRFEISDGACREYKLADGVARRADALAFEYGSAAQHKISFHDITFHRGRTGEHAGPF